MLRRWRDLAVIALAGVLFLVGCGPATGAGADNRSAAETPKAGAPISPAPTYPPRQGAAAPDNGSKDSAWTKKAGDLQVTLKITPYPPQGRNPSSYEVTLADSAGRPVSDAVVRLDLTMPGMWMPPNQPEARATGDGHYTASTRMGMRGEWQIAVLIGLKGQELRADFPAEVP